MVASLLSLFAAASLVAFANAQAEPFLPSQLYQSGQNCTVGWTGDKSGTGAWKNMAIELMDGPNQPMVHLTTVATGLDGTVDGTFSHICPDVTINAQIYFYQFTSPGDGGNVTWTTRFTISRAGDGHTDAAPSSTQPDGSPTPWGEAALDNPATAISAPTFAPHDQKDGSAGASTSGSSLTLATTTSSPTSTSSSTTSTSHTSSTADSSTTTAINSKTNDNGAARIDLPLVQLAVVLAASLMGFSILL